MTFGLYLTRNQDAKRGGATKFHEREYCKCTTIANCQRQSLRDRSCWTRCATASAKDRVTILPEGLIEPLKQWLVRVKALHEKDLADGYGKVRV